MNTNPTHRNAQTIKESIPPSNDHHWDTSRKKRVSFLRASVRGFVKEFPVLLVPIYTYTGTRTNTDDALYECVVTVTVSASEEEAHYVQSTSAPLDSYFAFRTRDLRSKERQKRGPVTHTLWYSTRFYHGTVIAHVVIPSVYFRIWNFALILASFAMVERSLNHVVERSMINRVVASIMAQLETCKF